MGPVEIVIIVIAVIAVIGVLASIIVSKLKGKPSCCSDCAGCPHAKACAHNCPSAKAGKDFNNVHKHEGKAECCGCCSSDGKEEQSRKTDK